MDQAKTALEGRLHNDSSGDATRSKDSSLFDYEDEEREHRRIIAK
jgi:hypothetical protein